MSASELLAELRECGVELVATGGQLRYRPREAVTPQLLDQLREHKPDLLKLLELEQYRFQGVNFYSEDSRPEIRNLITVGWKPKERCDKTIWQSPHNGFWYSRDMTLMLLRLDPLAQFTPPPEDPRGGGY